MIFSDEMIEYLDIEVKKRISTWRYIHTLGVRKAAMKIASRCYRGDLSEVSAAAMLHDIAKEIPISEQLSIIAQSDISISSADLLSTQILHSFAAPSIIRSDFSEFATDNVISAVFNHTTGAPAMSVFDEIIFIADYIEEGRTYDSCIAVRDFLYSSFEVQQSMEECISLLHKAVIMALDYTIIDLLKKKKIISDRTVLTRNAFISREQFNERN